MATLITTRGGRRLIQFGPRKRRRTIRLGKVRDTVAASIFDHIGHLITEKDLGHPIPRQTVAWLAKLGGKMQRQLAAAGLIEPQAEPPLITICQMIAQYIDRRTDLKPSTKTVLHRARKSLVSYFGDRDIRTITTADARDWKRQAKGAKATVATFVKRARQFFNDAVERKLVDDNPFRKIKAGKDSNPERLRYIPLADIERVIEKCPNAEWRLLFAVARLAGLRITSEIAGMKWGDVDFFRNQVRVRSPKTEHHEGRSTRIIPMFEGLLPYFTDQLESCDDQSDDGFVFPRIRTLNPRTTARKFIRRAGLEPWPRLFQNLRSSCETDLTTKVPLHVACIWIGNSKAVAVEHYLQVKPEHFDVATGAGKALHTGGSETPVSPDAPRLPHSVTGVMGRRGLESPAKFIGSLSAAEKALAKRVTRARRALSQYRVRAVRRLELAVCQSQGRVGR